MTLLNLTKMALLILLIEVGKAEFHYCRADERAEEGNPLLTCGLWVGHALAHQKESIGEHMDNL